MFLLIDHMSILQRLIGIELDKLFKGQLRQFHIRMGGVMIMIVIMIASRSMHMMLMGLVMMSMIMLASWAMLVMLIFNIVLF